MAGQDYYFFYDMQRYVLNDKLSGNKNRYEMLAFV
jgi:hypothetical protein